MGFLYVIKSKGLTKIGVTVDIQRRMNELKPDKICQVVELPRERELEKKLHRLFADKRLPGSEYFFLSWTERRRACRLARQAGKRVRFSHPAPRQAPRQAPARWLRPTVVLEVCGLGLAAGVATVLIRQSQPDVQPRQAPVSFAAPTKSFVSV